VTNLIEVVCIASRQEIFFMHKGCPANKNRNRGNGGPPPRKQITVDEDKKRIQEQGQSVCNYGIMYSHLGSESKATAAQMFRLRQKEHTEKLETDMTRLTEERIFYTSQVEKLKAENELLKQRQLYLRQFIQQALLAAMPPSEVDSSLGMAKPKQERAY
jgi:hypothetical protein